METVLGIAYLAAGYWAANRTIYANYIMFGSITSIFLRKIGTAFLLGWILIPVAVIKEIIQKKNQ